MTRELTLMDMATGTTHSVRMTGGDDLQPQQVEAVLRQAGEAVRCLTIAEEPVGSATPRAYETHVTLCDAWTEKGAGCVVLPGRPTDVAKGTTLRFGGIRLKVTEIKVIALWDPPYSPG